MQFYFRSKHTETECTYALVSMWSEPDAGLLKQSSQAVYKCSYRGQDDLHVIKVTTISAVVAMVPMRPSEGDRCAHFFLVEKPGLDTLASTDLNHANEE